MGKSCHFLLKKFQSLKIEELLKGYTIDKKLLNSLKSYKMRDLTWKPNVVQKKAKLIVLEILNIFFSFSRRKLIRLFA